MKANEINSEMNKIIGLAEGYPELKASEQYLNLQKSLEKVESQIQAARRAYNMDVNSYNTDLESIPTNVIVPKAESSGRSSIGQPFSRPAL